MALDLQAISNTLKTFAQEGTDFVFLASMVLGVVLVFMGLVDFVKKGKGGAGGYGQEKGWGAIAGRVMAGSCLITLAQKLEMIIATNGNTEPMKQALAYVQQTSSGGGGGTLSFVWAAISAWVIFMGTVGFMRGFLLFNKASQGGQDSGDAFWRGLWHVIGGALAVNIFS